MLTLIANFDRLKGTLAGAAGAPLPIASVQLLAPIPRPARNVFCVGKNYHEHAKEFAGSGFDSSAKEVVPEAPVIFTKPSSTVIGPGDVDPELSRSDRQHRLRGRADGGHRPRRPRHQQGRTR